MKSNGQFGTALPVLLLVILTACSESPITLQQANYVGAVHDQRCKGLRTENSLDIAPAADQLGYSLRAPANFEFLVRHPLLVVFPAAGHNSRQSEKFSRFTEPATAQGAVVLYPSHRRLSLRQLERLAILVADIATQWCIDPTRIFFTGHSDGGTVSHVLSQRNGFQFIPAKIAPSAAGVRHSDLEELGCNTRLPVLLMHNSDDQLFPGFGQSARDWWLSCNRCELKPAKTNPVCQDYFPCAGGSSVKFCQAEGGHKQWPQARVEILDFLLN